MLAQGTLLIILASLGHFLWHICNCFKKQAHAEPTSSTVGSTTGFQIRGDFLPPTLLGFPQHNKSVICPTAFRYLIS